MSDLRDFTGKNRKFTGTDGIVIPSGTTAQRPSGEAGQTRYNSDNGSIEFYDGTNWVATNLIPEITSVTGNIINSVAGSLTVNATNNTDEITVVFAESGITIEEVSGVSMTAGSGSVSVPSAVYNQTAGDTIAISLKNSDGTPSSNSVSKTVVSAPTGGSISNSGGYRIHTFTGASTFTTSFELTGVEALIVAGGGGGGADNAGGGGAGGLLYYGAETPKTPNGAAFTLSAGSYPVSVGNGGNGVIQNGGSVGGGAPLADNGGNSSFNGNTAIGGGRGGSAEGPNPGAADGGSGGGAIGNTDGSQRVGSGTAGQGNPGGATANGGGGSGGGGAGATGSAGSGAIAGNGGNGLQYSISGSATYYAGGGAGGNENDNTTAVSGGLGGGGGTSGGAGQAGTNGLGGGGGGSANPFPAGQRGGSGVVIIRYQL